VAEDADNLAFLDINPLTHGHTLVVPKQETDYLFDLADDGYVSLQMFAKKVALALQRVYPHKRVGTAVMGLEVPHAHIHLIPFQTMSEFNFANPKLQLSKEQLSETAEKIRAAFS
jgi:histidine triad (HIT) family protein